MMFLMYWVVGMGGHPIANEMRLSAGNIISYWGCAGFVLDGCQTCRTIGRGFVNLSHNLELQKNL
jgi:hypothetical protein